MVGSDAGLVLSFPLPYPPIKLLRNLAIRMTNVLVRTTDIFIPSAIGKLGLGEFTLPMPASSADTQLTTLALTLSPTLQ
jgi:hypothetical protein